MHAACSSGLAASVCRGRGRRALWPNFSRSSQPCHSHTSRPSRAAIHVADLGSGPGADRVVRPFSLALGHGRLVRAASSSRGTSPPCLAATGGVPGRILHDRVRTAVPGGVDERGAVDSDEPLALAACHRLVPEACRPYRAKTEGEAERPSRHVREDLFLARNSRDLDDPNVWLDRTADRRLHGTAGRIVAGRSAGERSSPGPPAGPSDAAPGLGRRISCEGAVPAGGNPYPVPDGTRRRPIEVRVTSREVRVLEDGRVTAPRPVP